MFIGAIAGTLLALGVFGAVAWQRLDQFNSRFGAANFSATPSTSSEPTPSTEKASAETRPAYRYSVIPGGVRTPEELIEAMASDSVVAGHYAGIDKAHLTTARLNEPLQAHVSYRIGERVYWTKRKVTIQAGEQVVTDGKTMVRGRCGNNISVAPLLPTLDNEPKPDVFDSIVSPAPTQSVVQLDPAHSYFTPKDLKTPQGPGGSSGAAFGNSSAIGFPVPPPPGGGVPSSTSSSGEVSPNGVPPGGNPPGDPPGNPCEAAAANSSREGTPAAATSACGGNPPGDNPPGGDPKGDPPGNPPNDFTPLDVPTPVPEPGTLLLVAGGAAALLARRIRKQAREATSAFQNLQK